MWINLFLVNIKVVFWKIESIKEKKVSIILIKFKSDYLKRLIYIKVEGMFITKCG